MLIKIDVILSISVRKPELRIRSTIKHRKLKVFSTGVDWIGGAEGDRTPDLMTASSSQAIFLNQNN